MKYRIRFYKVMYQEYGELVVERYDNKQEATKRRAFLRSLMRSQPEIKQVILAAVNG